MQGFPRLFTHEGDKCRGQSVNGGWELMRGDIDLMGGPNFDRLYHKLKVLLLLSCNYMMQFVSYDSYYLSLSCLESCCFLATFREMLLPSSGKCEGRIWNFRPKGDGRSGP